MKHRLFVIATVLAIFAVLSTTAFGQAKVKLIIASDCTFPPMEYVDANKNIVGFDVDVLNAIAAASNLDITIKNTAWDGIFAGLANKEYDAVCSSVTITDERKVQMDFSKPYVNAGQILVVQTGTNNVTTVADLAGKKVGAQIGTTGAIEVKKVAGVTLATYDEIGLAFEDLVQGRIAGAVVDGPTATQFALQSDSYKGKLKIVGKPFTDEYYGIAVNKGNKKVLDLLNAGLDKITASGKLADLEKKWLR
jgi:polar amino acid transport system substrate-binding protein